MLYVAKKNTMFRFLLHLLFNIISKYEVRFVVLKNKFLKSVNCISHCKTYLDVTKKCQLKYDIYIITHELYDSAYLNSHKIIVFLQKATNE